MSESRQPTTEELILQVLREVLARQETARSEMPVTDRPALGGKPLAAKLPAAKSPAVAEEGQNADRKLPDRLSPAASREIEPETGLRRSEIEQLDLYETLARAPAPHEAGARRLLFRLIAGVFLTIILINIPLFKGLPLARALPDTRALIVRDGLVLKDSGPEIYVLQDNQKRWISSLDAFTHYGYSWEEVHVVDDAFLAQFPEGPALHVLLRCPTSPHIYRLENNQKRWIKDIATFEAEGHVWEDVSVVDCVYLRSLADGPTLPLDAGPPPQP